MAIKQLFPKKSVTKNDVLPLGVGKNGYALRAKRIGYKFNHQSCHSSQKQQPTPTYNIPMTCNFHMPNICIGCIVLNLPLVVPCIFSTHQTIKIRFRILAFCFDRGHFLFSLAVTYKVILIYFTFLFLILEIKKKTNRLSFLPVLCFLPWLPLFDFEHQC